MSTVNELFFITIVTMLLTSMVTLTDPITGANSYMNRLNSTIYNNLPSAPTPVDKMPHNATTDIVSAIINFCDGVVTYLENLGSQALYYADMIASYIEMMFGLSGLVFEALTSSMLQMWGFPIIGPLVCIFWLISSALFLGNIISGLTGMLGKEA
jgi:hypothetical protein